MKNRIAARWIAKQAAPPSLKDILVNLKTLGELSQNIEDVTDTFGMHYKMAAVDTNIASQLDALKKARSGLKAAQATQQAVLTILGSYPEDKTALRASKDALVMVKRFEKHLNDANKMVRTLSKKQMPPALKKVVAAATRMLKSKLVDPKKLQVIPWQDPHGGFSYGGKGQVFMVVFRIEDPDLLGTDRGRAELTVWENTGTAKGPSVNSRGQLISVDAKRVTKSFLESLTGWPGMKGEAEASQARKTTALAIADVVQRACDSMGMNWSQRDAEVSKDFMQVEGSYRSSNLPKEGESEYGWQRYEEMVEEELKRYHAKLDPALKPYMKHIKNIDVHTGEKSWVYTYIYLK